MGVFMLFQCGQALVEHIAEAMGGHADVGDGNLGGGGVFVVDDEARALTVEDVEGLEFEAADVGQLDVGHEPSAADDVSVVYGDGRVGYCDVWTVGQMFIQYDNKEQNPAAAEKHGAEPCPHVVPLGMVYDGIDSYACEYDAYKNDDALLPKGIIYFQFFHAD